MITENDIKQLLNEKTAILKKGVLEKMPSPPQAIYLVGGYGREEGAWFEDEEGLHPYNDFDLAVITNNPLSHNDTELLRKELAQAVDIRWVDIDYYSLEGLRRMKPTIHNVDLFDGSCLIYGEDVITKNNLHLDGGKIGKEDLITLYWTRMWTFLGSWDGPFRDLDALEARFFKNQMAKAILAACDMRLVKQKRYITSYRKRADIVLKERNEDKDFCELVSWAINEKMRPSNTVIDCDDMKKLYFRAKDLFVNSFEYALGEDSHFFLNPEKTRTYYLLYTKSYLYHIYSLLRNHKSRIARQLDVFYAMNFIFHANHKGKIEKTNLCKAAKLLIKHNFINHYECNWDVLRRESAIARNNV